MEACILRTANDFDSFIVLRHTLIVPFLFLAFCGLLILQKAWSLKHCFLESDSFRAVLVLQAFFFLVTEVLNFAHIIL